MEELVFLSTTQLAAAIRAGHVSDQVKEGVYPARHASPVRKI